MPDESSKLDRQQGFGYSSILDRGRLFFLSAGGAVSLPVLGDLLTSLLSLNGEGLPIIGGVLEAAGGAGSLDVAALGNILDGLLANLLGVFGGGAGAGGFLNGTQGLLSLGNVVPGLLSSVLGGLSL